MAQRTLVRRTVALSTESNGPRPHFSAHTSGEGRRPVFAQTQYSGNLASDDLMHVDLPRSDYVLAALVAVLVSMTVAAVTVLPAIVFFDWLVFASGSLWAKLLLAVPVGCGIVGAWSCLRRAKSERVRDQLLSELRD